MIRLEKNSQIPSLRTRLISMQVLVAVGVLILCTTTFVVNDIRLFKETTSKSLGAEARLLALNIKSALQFVDKTEIRNILDHLKTDTNMKSAAAFDSQGVLFGEFGERIDNLKPPTFIRDEYILKINKEDITIFFPIWNEKDFIGTLYMKESLDPLWELYRRDAYIAIGVLTLGLLIAYLLAIFMQRILSFPITNLARAAKRVSIDGDYSMRIPEESKNPTEEIVILSREFNHMLEQIQLREKEIQATNEMLEKRVEERTNELQETQKLALDNAHSAGMAEIATGILHNIGNIVNSVNTSAEEIYDVTHKSNTTGLMKANDLLRTNLGQIATFIASEKGKELTQYYFELGEVLKAEQEKIQSEVAAMAKNISLIKEVIQSQQDYAKKRLFVEEVRLNELMDDIIEMQGATFRRHNIQILRKYSETPLVHVQRGKLANVLLNLLKNAKEAMNATDAARRLLTIEIGRNNKEDFFLKLTDAGAGVSKNDLEKIFTHGFTTKQKGHGFGLHFCANAMTEMGGKLILESEGTGRGATFILTFPHSIEIGVSHV
ncbi:MAG: zraS 2 [Bacteriovoracaceae bacterium]|nr:zraS 2 [Bacteriovoracaceae bacterium]